MSGRLVATNGIQLWAELDGDEGAPALVLLGGADATVLRWPADLIAEPAAAGYRVVRLEHRDSGRSSRIDPERPYRLEDLADDVAGALQALGIDGADIVGYSMGGAVAQVLALEHAPLVRSLVLLATTPGAGDERLPGPDDDFVDRMAERLFSPPPRTHDERVAWTVALYRMLAGPRYAFDESAQRQLASAEIERAWHPDSGHGIAATASPSRLDRLSEIRVPTLVVHGDRDVVYALEHARALEAGIPGATLVVVEGLGHEVPAAFGPELAALVLRHLATR
jgi:pimeloyl-ACP methyl ester carboxylesterase